MADNQDAFKTIEQRIDKLEEHAALFYPSLGGGPPRAPPIYLDYIVKMIMGHLGIELVPETKRPARFVQSDELVKPLERK